jgi:hypothetical protein
MLPPSLPKLRAKNGIVRKTHNRIVVLMLLGFWFAFFLTIKMMNLGASKSERGNIGLACAVTIVCAEAYAFYRLFRHERKLCRQINYVCPSCGEPLYPFCSKRLESPSSSLFRTGKCPMCRAVLNDF